MRYCGSMSYCVGVRCWECACLWWGSKFRTSNPGVWNVFFWLKSMAGATLLQEGRSGVSLLAVARNLSLLQNIGTGSGAHSASCSTSTRVLCSGVKRLECEVAHSPTSNAETKTEWSYTSTSSIRLHGVDRDNFTLHCPYEPQHWKHTVFKSTTSIRHTAYISFIII